MWQTHSLISLISEFDSVKIHFSNELCFLILEDEQFNDEKEYLIKQIKELQPSQQTTSSSSKADAVQTG